MRAFTGIPCHRQRRASRQLRGLGVVRVEQAAQELLVLDREILSRYPVGAIPQHLPCRSALRYPIADPLMGAMAVEGVLVDPQRPLNSYCRKAA